MLESILSPFRKHVWIHRETCWIFLETCLSLYFNHLLLSYWISYWIHAWFHSNRFRIRFEFLVALPMDSFYLFWIHVESSLGLFLIHVWIYLELNIESFLNQVLNPFWVCVESVCDSFFESFLGSAFDSMFESFSTAFSSLILQDIVLLFEVFWNQFWILFESYVMI